MAGCVSSDDLYRSDVTCRDCSNVPADQVRFQCPNTTPAASFSVILVLSATDVEWPATFRTCLPIRTTRPTNQSTTISREQAGARLLSAGLLRWRRLQELRRINVQYLGWL